MVLDRDQFFALFFIPGTDVDLRSAPRHTVFSHLLTDDDSDNDARKASPVPRTLPTIEDADGDIDPDAEIDTMTSEPGASAPFNFNTSSLAGSSSAGTPATVSVSHGHHHNHVAASHREASPHDDDDGDGIPPNATVYQTTGPNAYTRPIEAPDGSGPAFNPRSCVTCRRRKVKCDKQMPCTTCRKALIPCIFPAPGRKPRQTRPKDPNAPPKSFSKREVELVKRLKKLEGIVEELSGQIEVDSKGNSPDAPPFSPSSMRNALRQSSGAFGDSSMSPSARSPKDTDSISDASEAAKRNQLNTKFGRLVLNDHKGRTKYVSSAFWSKMSDDIAALRRDTQALTDNESEASDSDESNDESPLDHKAAQGHHSFLLGYSSADVDLRKLYPAPTHIWFLWKIYQDVVEPLIKVIHVPTTDQLLRDATKNLDDLSAGKQALVFCIIFAAVVALEPEDAERNFNTTKPNLVAQYRFAAEMALAKADILTTTDFTVIQALTIFLVCVKAFDTSRFCWSMTGLIIRLAMGMGLHRDGAHFDLAPFEIELRRRVWWAIMKLDMRSSEELGTDLTIDNRGFDTEMPTNVDDNDIGPESTVIVAKEGRSDMSVMLLRCEITNMARRILTATSAAGTLCPVDGQNGFQDLERLLLDFYHTRVEKQIFKHSLDGKGYVDPVFWVATVISRLVMSKLYLLIYQPELFNDSGALSAEVRQRIYSSAIEILECDNRLNTDTRAHPYRWLFLTYCSWQAVSYSLVTSARCAWTPLSERCWEAICSFKRVPVETSKRANHSAVFLPLRRLFLIVRKHRAAEIARLKANPEEAKRLDDEEMMNAHGHWLQPLAGDQERMQDIRAKWWALIGGDPNNAPKAESRPQDPIQCAPQQPPQQQSGISGSGSPVDMSMQMQYLNQMMSQPNLTMAELFSLQNQSRTFEQNVGPQMGMPQDPSAFTAPMFNQGLNTTPITQQQQQQLPGDENLPPFMYGGWPGGDLPVGGLPAGGMGMEMNGEKELGDKNLRAADVMAGGMDVDMLNGEFDWQDWTQVMNGIDMWQGGEAPGARV